MDKKILIIDDDRAVCSSLKLLLKKNGYSAESINHPSEAMDKVAVYSPDLVMLDMNFTIDTSGKQGIAMLRKIKDFHPDISVILMTGWATLQLAVQGMKIGAKDFLAKPWDNKHLLGSIETILALAEGKLPNRVREKEGNNKIIGKNESLLKVMDMVDRVAETEAAVLIMGESGTGKELVAEAIHYQSFRKNHNFVKVNLGGISSTLFESEMFGHAKGAFTDASTHREGRFAKANNGSIFLDEIGDLPLSNQVKLLRVLQEKQYEVLGSSQTVKTDSRIISATNKNLEEHVHRGLFREDLFYRINLITLKIPSLSERRDDIPILIDHFLKNLNTLYDLEIYVGDEAKKWMTMQDYPGNVRQLKNIVERTILLATNKKDISTSDFQKNFNSFMQGGKQNVLPGVGEISLEEMEKSMITKSLEYHNFNISQAASSLGISRNALYRRMEKFNIPNEY